MSARTVRRRHLQSPEVPALQPEHLHHPEAAREGRRPGEEATCGRRSVDPRGDWRSAATCSSRSCRGNGYNFEDSILLSERMCRYVFTSIHIEEFEVMARDTKLARRRSAGHPNVGEERSRTSTRRHRLYRRQVKAGDILVGKVDAQGREPDDAGGRSCCAPSSARRRPMCATPLSRCRRVSRVPSSRSACSTGAASTRTSARSPRA